MKLDIIIILCVIDKKKQHTRENIKSSNKRGEKNNMNEMKMETLHKNARVHEDKKTHVKKAEKIKSCTRTKQWKQRKRKIFLYRHHGARCATPKSQESHISILL